MQEEPGTRFRIVFIHHIMYNNSQSFWSEISNITFTPLELRMLVIDKLIETPDDGK